MSSDEVWDDGAAIDEAALRPVVHRVVAELLNSSTGTLSLTNLRKRLVEEEVMTPAQASSQSEWIARETQSFLDQEENSDSDTGSHDVRQMQDLSDLEEEGGDLFANVSQMFGLESESSDAKRRKTVPLNLSQQAMDENEDGDGNDDDDNGGKKAQWKVRQQKRKRAYVRWHAGTLDPIWPEGVARAECTSCKLRKPDKHCKNRMCTLCCLDAIDPCPSHAVRLRSGKCNKCGSSVVSKFCAFGLCFFCCAARRDDICPRHLRAGQLLSLRQLSLGRTHPCTMVDRNAAVELLSLSMFTDWSAGLMPSLASAAEQRLELGLVRRLHTSHESSLFELCAFLMGVVQQIAPRGRQLDMLQASCRTWLGRVRNKRERKSVSISMIDGWFFFSFFLFREAVSARSRWRLSWQ